ncbi:MAG: hypothetical protein DRZ82_02555 [Thermoprotei archaeon]|nr:MAG: hypothetical protein DRZ82_02555 [Thermoprotei archaeon]
MESLIRILVRAKKDKDAVTATIRTFYGDWGGQIDVTSMGGVRRYNDLVKRIEEESKGYDGLIVVLCPREMKELRNYRAHPMNVRLVNLDKAKVRNARISEIFWAIEKGKALFRIYARWHPDKQGYVHFGTIGEPLRLKCKPTYDMYYAIGKPHKELFTELFGAPIGENPLVVKYDEGVHEVFQGSSMALRILIPYEYDEDVRLVGKGEYEPIDVNISSCINLNKSYLLFLERYAFKIFKWAEANTEYDYDRVIVPWSGGKDSTVALILSIKYFGKENVVPIYVDTCLDLPLNIKYIDEIARRLNIDYVYAKADISIELKKRGSLPTKDDRWCTKIKIKGLYDAMKKISDRPLIVVGDRDCESLSRLRRPFVRWHEGMLQIAPIKIWSTALVQLYLAMNGVRLNPLYELGFYRLGCYICPAFRSWERRILEKYFQELATYRKRFSTLKYA